MGGANMRLVDLPPYSNVVMKGQPMAREIIENLKRKGQLDGIEIDVDDAYPTEWTNESRDEEFLAHISLGLVKRVQELAESGKYDAIVSHGSIEPGVAAARQVCKIPFVSAVHSAVHVASLIGERFTIIEATDTQAQIVRRLAESYGFGRKLVSVRYPSFSSTRFGKLFKEHKKEERGNVPELKKAIEDIVAQCATAVEEDRADTIILACTPLQVLEDEIRQGLDEAGYDEIQIICETAAAIEMARVMVNMRLTLSKRAYPSDELRKKPAFR